MPALLFKPLTYAAVCSGILCAAPAAAGPTQVQKLVYVAHHSRYGRIGTFTNTITRNGDETEVDTEIRIAVSFLGITAFRQNASRQERWKDGRLVSFHGVTTTNGNSIELSGAAQGDHFVLQKANGEMVVAPADVKLANPWSAAALRGNMMFTTDRGRLDDVNVTTGSTDINIGGKPVHATRYDVYLIDGMKKYEVDVGDGGTVDQFVIYNLGGAITFSLGG
jgi:hypothetical protein